jgi:hypothetical protein
MGDTPHHICLDVSIVSKFYLTFFSQACALVSVVLDLYGYGGKKLNLDGSQVSIG